MKKSYQKALSALLCGIFASASLTGCMTTPATPKNDDSIKIIATNFALYDFARVWETDGIDAEMLIAPGSESHDLEATLQDISAIGEADIFVYAGGESDAWVSDVFEALGEAGESIIRINALELITGEVWDSHDHEGHEEHDHSDHGDSVAPDEHVWTSIPNAIALIEEIGRAVGEVAAEIEAMEPDREAANTYIEKLTELDEAYRSTVATAKRREIAVADRFPFTHMAEEYGITYSAAFEGCTSNVEVPLSVINGMIGEVKAKNLPVVFYIEFSDQTAADAVCTETSAVPLLLHSCHNVTKAELDAGATYLDLMTQNLTNLQQALN